MAKSEYYTILAGRKEPAKVLQGALSKTTGMPTGTPQKVLVMVGAILIPNWSRAWGRRVAEPSNPSKKTSEDRSVAVTHPDYRGLIEFLPYGHSNGEAIEIRYLPNSGTLDKLYQDTVQKIVPRQEDAMIILQQGLNNFDEEKEKMKVMMLKHHSLNLNSPCRSEDATDYDFVNFDSEGRNKSRMQVLNIKAEANEFIRLADADKNGMLLVLAEIFNQDSRQQPGLLLEYLLDKATDFPVEFVNAINEFKKQVETSLVESLEVGILELRDNGKLILKAEGDNPSETLLQEVEGEGNDRKLWLIQQAVSNLSVYEAMKKIIKALDRYYKQLV